MEDIHDSLSRCFWKSSLGSYLRVRIQLTQGLNGERSMTSCHHSHFYCLCWNFPVWLIQDLCSLCDLYEGAKWGHLSLRSLRKAGMVARTARPPGIHCVLVSGVQCRCCINAAKRIGGAELVTWAAKDTATHTAKKSPTNRILFNPSEVTKTASH